MTSATLAMLEQDELLQLALNASAGNDAGSAIAYLKEAVTRPDATAVAHYLLGAEYAQSGMYPRALDEMEAALALDPALHTARLQLGLLLLGANQPARAAEVLAGLELLGAHDPLRHFGAGLGHLIRDELGAALATLREGVALNSANPALNGDMEAIMARTEQAMADAAQAAPEEPGQHILLSAYKH